MTILCGIDYSMTSPAIAIYDTKDEFKFENFILYNLCDTKKYQGVHGNIFVDPMPLWNSPEERFSKICSWAAKIVEVHGVEKVVLEGYSLGSTKGLVFQIAEHTSLLKQKLYTSGIPFTNPSPSSVKKNFTGKGNAKKPDMCLEFANKFGVSLSSILGCVESKGIDNDLVDAVANMMMHEELKCMN